MVIKDTEWNLPHMKLVIVSANVRQLDTITYFTKNYEVKVPKVLKVDKPSRIEIKWSRRDTPELSRDKNKTEN